MPPLSETLIAPDPEDREATTLEERALAVAAIPKPIPPRQRDSPNADNHKDGEDDGEKSRASAYQYDQSGHSFLRSSRIVEIQDCQ